MRTIINPFKLWRRKEELIGSSSSSVSSFVELKSVYTRLSCYLFLGRPLLLFSFIILLNILSSDILTTCAYHSSFLLLIHSLIFWMPHTSLISSLFSVSNSVKCLTSSVRLLPRFVLFSLFLVLFQRRMHGTYGLKWLKKHSINFFIGN